MKLLLVSPLQKQANGGIAVWTDMFLECCKTTEIEPTVVNIAMTGRRLENGSAKRSLIDEIRRTRAIFRDLKRALKRDKYDVAHINTSCASFGIMRDLLIAKRIRKKQPDAKIAVHYHCDIPVQIKKKSAYKHLLRLCRIADINFVLCDTSAEYLKNKFGVDSTRLPNFIDERCIREEPKIINENIEKAFFVGRVQTAKGVKEIYEIAQRFPGMIFELAGAVSSVVAGWNKPQNVVLLGPMEHGDVIKKMDEADIFVFPTHTEGFSLALAEAMARGLPAVTTAVGANSDMLETGGGIVCSPGDVDSMLEAIKLLACADVRRKMSEWCIRKTRDNYASEKVMRLLIKKYEEARE